jgi:hypothetical protein
MANTYTQIYLHIVFAVEARQNLIAPEHNDELRVEMLEKFGVDYDQRYIFKTEGE